MDIHHINRLYLPAKERYEQLLREQPDVIHRAQLGYIASFLGMTPQHLSRLRSESWVLFNLCEFLYHRKTVLLQPNTKKKQINVVINTLTSLRIFFALMVFGAHCYVLDTSFDTHFFKEGFVGVSFFLSSAGLLLPTIIRKNYWQKRLLNARSG
mgnify:CR=1 FL=1